MRREYGSDMDRTEHLVREWLASRGQPRWLGKFYVRLLGRRYVERIIKATGVDPWKV